MKRKFVVVLSVALILGASMALASGGGRHTGTPSASSTAGVSVTIPGVVGMDVETDMVWTFADYPAQDPGAPAQCPADTWPLQPNCTGTADYFPNDSTTTGGVTDPNTNPGGVWIAVFSNYAAGGTTTISISAPALSGTPWTGYAAGNFYYQKDSSSTFNVPGAGPGSWTSVPTTATSIGGTAPTTPFNWTRVDQDFKFTVPSAGSALFTAGTYTTTVTLTITHS